MHINIGRVRLPWWRPAVLAPWMLTGRVPIAPGLSWWTTENDTDLGVETQIFFEYNYSEDLTFELGWAHIFTGDGLAEGNYSRWNGLLFTGGTDDDDADYVYAGAKIKF